MLSVGSMLVVMAILIIGFVIGILSFMTEVENHGVTYTMCGLATVIGGFLMYTGAKGCAA